MSFVKADTLILYKTVVAMMAKGKMNKGKSMARTKIQNQKTCFQACKPGNEGIVIQCNPLKGRLLLLRMTGVELHKCNFLSNSSLLYGEKEVVKGQ